MRIVEKARPINAFFIILTTNTSLSSDAISIKSIIHKTSKEGLEIAMIPNGLDVRPVSVKLRWLARKGQPVFSEQVSTEDIYSTFGSKIVD